MATFVSKSRVRETATTTGTGDFTLAAAVSDHQRFSAVMSVGDTCWYVINLVGSAQWEVGVGTYSALNTLTRTTVLESTNANALVNFSAGTKDVAMVFPGTHASHANNTIEETIASAATTNLGSVGTRRIAISGVAAITSFGATVNLVKFLRFTGVMTITHNAATLICPAGASIITASGDTAVASSDASGNWRIWHYQRTANAAGSAFPPTTAIPFYQAAAPTGWTKSSANHDKSIRIVNDGNGGTTGGTLAFSTVFGRTATDGHTLTQAETPAHTHSVSIIDPGHNHSVNLSDPGHGHGVTDPGHSHNASNGQSIYTTAGSGTAFAAGGNFITTSGLSTNTTGVTVNSNGTGIGVSNDANTTGITATTGNIGSGGSHTHPIDMRVQYLNMIVATKD